MTVDELMKHVLRVCPNATCNTDLDGQLVIYTDLNPDRDQNLTLQRKETNDECNTNRRLR